MSLAWSLTTAFLQPITLELRGFVNMEEFSVISVSQSQATKIQSLVA